MRISVLVTAKGTSMSKYEPIATGRIESLSVNGNPVQKIMFTLGGPEGDVHYGATRKLAGHDSTYIRTSASKRGDLVFNWRTWTALSSEEIQGVETTLGVPIPQGCLLENIVLSGIPNFSKLPPTSRLVFKSWGMADLQAILGVWEENTPCRVVGDRLAKLHGDGALTKRFVEAAKGKRGLMGFVLSPGFVFVGDPVLVYPPA